MISTRNRFPYFVPNQLLKAQQLNDMVSFLDESSRQTRIYTIGIGIVYGFELSEYTPSKDSSNEESVSEDGPSEDGIKGIKITAGLGISSDGFLFRLNEDKIFNKYRKVSISKRAFQCVPQDERFVNIDTEDFYELGIEGELPIGDEKLYKDLKGFGTEADSLGLDLKTLAIVMLWTREEVQRAVCFNPCDEGSESSVSVKILLANSQFICNPNGNGEDNTSESKEENSSENDEEDAVDSSDPPSQKKEIAPGNPFLKRLNWYLCDNEKRELAVYSGSSDALFTAYENLSQAAISEIVSAVKALKGTPFSIPDTTIQQIETGLTQLLGPGKLGPTYHIQYAYSYFKDFIAAYYEFKESLGDLEAKDQEIPNECEFPGFIRLGTLSDVNQCKDFYQASTLQEIEADSNQKAVFLFERLKNFILFENFPNLPTGEIKITASKGRNLPLSQRAIPYYLKNIPLVRTGWNYELTKGNNTDSIPSYHRQGEMPFSEHLDYEIDAFTFFRIEGHLGKELDAVVSSIDWERRCRTLPFDIRCVKIDDEKSQEEKDETSAFTQLELHYQNTLCDIEEAVGLITNPISFQQNGIRELFPSSLREYCQEGIISAEAKRVLAQNPSATCYLDFLDLLCKKYSTYNRPFTLSEFVQLHPGTEHLGGVPKGGTFIILYRDQEGSSEFNPVSKQVIGDFCLPYYCGGEGAPPTPIEPLIYMYPKDFCQGDSQQYEVLTYPKGGKLTGSVEGDGNYIQAENEKFYFIPAGVPDDMFMEGSVEIELTYQAPNGLTASTKLQVEELDADFTITESWVYGGKHGCTLVGKKITLTQTGDGEFVEWRIDGKPHAENEHQLMFGDLIRGELSDPVPIQLVVQKGACRGGKKKEVTLCPEEVSLELGLMDGEEVVMIKNDSTIIRSSDGPKRIQVLLDPITEPISIDPQQIRDPSGVYNIAAYLEVVKEENCENNQFFFYFNDEQYWEENDIPRLPEGVYTFTVSYPGCDKTAEIQIEIKDSNSEQPVEFDEASDRANSSGDLEEGTESSARTRLSQAQQRVVNNRVTAYKKVFADIQKETVLVSKSSFANAMKLVYAEQKDIKELNSLFKKTLGGLTRQLAKADKPKLTQLKQLINTVFHSYLDKLVLQDRNAAPPESMKILTDSIENLNKLDTVNGEDIRKTWKANALKKSLKAPATDAYVEVLKGGKEKN